LILKCVVLQCVALMQVCSSSCGLSDVVPVCLVGDCDIFFWYMMLSCGSYVFAVPFDEDEREASVWFLDHDYLENMYGMFKKVNG